MFRPSVVHVRLRGLNARLCWSAIGSGLAIGLMLQFAMTLVLFAMEANPSPGYSSAQIGLMASASVAALVGGAIAGALAGYVSGRSFAANAYAAWLATSAILMIQIATTTDVLSA